MSNNFKELSKFLKNPIGVIGIFLVLTEAIASAVIMNSSLNDMQNTILVLFIVLFPCLVLFVFYLLVTRHHKKLYSPSDYKDEQNFVNTYNSFTQKDEIKKMISTEDKTAVQFEMMNKNITLIKDALVDIMGLQKKIVPTMENLVLSEEEKINYISSLDDYLLEFEVIGEIFNIQISPLYRSTELVEQLNQKGYIASIYRSDNNNKKVVSNEDNAAIWLGREVPVDMAVEVIKIAKKFYPHLTYIELNDCRYGAPEYVMYEIYIGGATTTARDRGLKRLEMSDFNKLYEMHEIHELHEFIEDLNNSEK